MRDSMIFYRSFFEAIKELELDKQAIIYTAIFDYGLNKIEPQLSGVTKTVWTLIKPQLDANYKKFENGSKPKKSKTEAKSKQNGSKSETNVNDNVNVNVNDNPNDNPNTNDNPKVKKSKKTFEVPLIEDVKSFFVEKGYTEKSAQSFFDYYSAGDWVDSQGTKVKNWKQKAIAIWFKPENENKANQIDIKTHAPVWKFENGDEVTVLKDGSKITANDYYGNEMAYIDKVLNWRKCR